MKPFNSRGDYFWKPWEIRRHPRTINGGSISPRSVNTKNHALHTFELVDHD